MIYLFTALYDEAYPFLQYYKMKKEINSLPFEMYRCEEQQICLTITGTAESKCVRGTCMSESGYAAKYGYGKSGKIM